MERKQSWYSVIQYIPNTLRGERINVGVILHQPTTGKVLYKLIEHNNPKIRGLLNNGVLIASYKLSKELIDYTLEDLPSVDSLLIKGVYNDNFLSDFSKHLPEGFVLSEPSYAMSAKTNALFNQLLINYIGKEFVTSEEKPSESTIKKNLETFFERKKLLGTKIKPNVKMSPIKDIGSMQYTIDFVYKNGVINLIQTVPQHTNALNNWFSRVNTFSSNYDSNAGIYLIYEESTINEDNTVVDMFNFLKGNDERIRTIDIASNELVTLTRNIEVDGKDIIEFEAELA